MGRFDYNACSMDIESIRSAVAHVDAAAFRAINGSLGCRLLDGPMVLLTGVGTGIFQTGVSLLLILAGLLRNRIDLKRAGCAGLAAFAVSGIAVQLAKHAFDRPRPLLALYDVRLVGDPLFVHSFPSGHTMTAFALMTALAATLPRMRWLFWTVAAMTGLSRIYLGLHFPLDVICGAAIGGLIGRLAARLVMRTQKQELRSATSHSD